MIDINAVDFSESFDIKKATVGVIGCGYVGSAVAAFFKKACRVLAYDKAMKETDPLSSVISQAEVIFVAVPTPMQEDGSCFTGIVESVLQDIKDAAKLSKRNLNSFVTVIKSTVPPGFTEEMQLKHYDMRFAFSPEFLTEKSSIQDFENQNRVIIGGDEEDALVVARYFEGVMPEKVAADKVLLLQCSSTTAELVKLYANGMLATKVLFSNELYQVCQKLGVEYDEVRALACLDTRIGIGHTSVPGPDGKLGFSGSCFPKDVNSLRHIVASLGLDDSLFRVIMKRNEELRGGRDWEELKGRAVV